MAAKFKISSEDFELGSTHGSSGWHFAMNTCTTLTLHPFYNTGTTFEYVVDDRKQRISYREAMASGILPQTELNEIGVSYNEVLHVQ